MSWRESGLGVALGLDRESRERRKAETDKAVKETTGFKDYEAFKESGFAASPEKAKAITLTKQEILLQNMRPIHTSVSPIGQQTRNQTLDSSRNTESLQRNKYILPCAGMPPEDIVSLLTDPTDMKPFHDATPAELASLEPTLRFFIVSPEEKLVGTKSIKDENGKTKKVKVFEKTGRQVQEEVYFSDFTRVDRIVKLANARAAKTVSETLTRGGSEAGIKSFNWKYHNKHEGDKIINADLELYFGTLSELINLNYLSFLFTNGRKSALAPKINKNKDRYSKENRLNELKVENEKLLKTLIPGSKIEVDDKVSNDFRQLKVVVGWAKPQGDPGALARLSGGTERRDRFLAAVEATQRVILLNLVNYDVNFSQEGPVTLKLEYVGSTDSYLGSPQSDVLGQNNFSKGNLNSQQVMVSIDDIKKSALLKEGYLKFQLDNFITKGLEIVPVRLDRLNREHQYLSGRREYLKLKSEGSRPKTAVTKQLEVIDEQMNLVETVYKRAQRGLRSSRYASLINNLIGGTGNASRVYMGTAARSSGGDIIFDLKPPIAGSSRADAARKAADNLKKLAELSEDERKEFLESNKISSEYTFKRGGSIESEDKTEEEKYIKIPFVFLGDIILAAMQNADMRGDIKFLLGTYCPKKLGIPGFEKDDSNFPIYDIPIALDYLAQFVYDNIISREIDEYPFRQFLDTLISAVSRLLNNLTSFKFRISFDYTVYMTDTLIRTEGEKALSEGKATVVRDSTLLITKDTLNGLSANLKGNFKNKVLTDNRKINSYYVLFVRQTNEKYSGDRAYDEKRGIKHYTLGADRGIVKNFNFSKQDVPQFKALNIEAIYSGPNAANFAQALILPQNVSLEMFGNAIHKNGDLIYIDSRAALGEFANEVLALGGYYRVVRSSNQISNRGFTTTVDAVFQHRTNSGKINIGSLAEANRRRN